MNCIYCNNDCVKRGERNNIQRYQCKHCKKYQQSLYKKPRISAEKYEWTHRLNNECCSISSISRLLRISKSSVQRVMKRLFSRTEKKVYQEENQSYEIDELRTYCGNKQNECWVIYAINRHTRRIIDFCVGRRTKENIKKVVDSVLSLNPKPVYTDGLNIYPGIIKKQLHKIYPYCTNHIERMNVNLRNGLKRLSRRTICYSKKENMLEISVHLWINIAA